MKSINPIFQSLFLLSLLGGSLDLWAGTEPAPISARPSGPPPLEYNFKSETSYVGGSEFRSGGVDSRPVDTLQNKVELGLKAPVIKGVRFTIGGEWERFGFGKKESVAIPNTLTSFSLPIGVEAKLTDKWLFNAVLTPSLANDGQELRVEDDFFFSARVGGGYIVNDDLTVFFGAQAAPGAKYPVLPSVGVLWNINQNWRLEALLPNPKIIYKLDDRWSFNAGAELLGGTYRVSSDFGRNNGRTETGRNLDNAVANYTEVRVGVGTEWKINQAFTAAFSSGVSAYREIDFDRADTKFRSTEPAPYVQVKLGASF